MPDLQQAVGRTAGDPIPAKCEVIEVHVAELKQLFNAIDPSPFREKDLDPNAEEFIVSWAREAARDAQLALLVYLDRPAGLPEEAAILKEAIQGFFAQRRDSTRQRLRQLFRVGRTSLVIGITFLAVSIGVGDFFAKALSGQRAGEILRESLLIGGWVAMWRPLEIFLYDWWPIRAEAKTFRSIVGHAGAHRLHAGRELGGLALGLAGSAGCAKGSGLVHASESRDLERPVPFDTRTKSPGRDPEIRRTRSSRRRPDGVVPAVVIWRSKKSRTGCTRAPATANQTGAFKTVVNQYVALQRCLTRSCFQCFRCFGTLTYVVTRSKRGRSAAGLLSQAVR